MNDKQVLDVCCGSRMLWFDKSNPLAVFGDLRSEEHVLCDGRELKISPDVRFDFTALPFKDKSFKLVVFDPPHLERAGRNGWVFKKYGVLQKSWREDLKLGFSECLRVLEVGGVLIFKWNETQIKTSEVLKLSPIKPLFGHISGKRANTHWVCFIKELCP